jgi:hypothetical protein
MPTHSGGGLFNGLSATPWGNYGYGYGESYYPSNQGGSARILQYVFYTGVLTLIILLILIVVHFTIRPVFKTSSVSKGFVPLPGFTKQVPVFWTDENKVFPIAETQTPVGTRTENYSFVLDIQLDDPLAQTQNPRVLFVRGPEMKSPSSTASVDPNATIRSIVPTFNSIVYLDRMTNDLNISVQCSKDRAGVEPLISEANIRIENIPIRKPIRLGVMVGSSVLEVYVNGYLARSKTFTVPLRAVQGLWQPPLPPIRQSCARVRNLRIYEYPLSPAEFRALGRAEEATFGLIAPPSTNQCGASQALPTNLPMNS